MSSAIKVENVSKRYRIYRSTGRSNYRTLREDVSRWASAPFRIRQRDSAHRGKEEFWALKDISFTLQEGNVVGVIGSNGAGKSTLLKILSRITRPTRGRAMLQGRVGSLLEVGTGFHPELTGRENIYLSGSILGMKRREIHDRFDSMVAFSGIEQFLDTPIKRYSSGMAVRLGFAVAAHLDPEILLIDEVLAVGDADFQRKCLGKLNEVARSGRTVVFVSHNLGAVEDLCDRVILLNGGQIQSDSDNGRDVIREYLSGGGEAEPQKPCWNNSGSEFANPWFQPLQMYLGDEQGEPVSMPVRNDAAVWFVVEGKVEQLHAAMNVGYQLEDGEGRILYWSVSTDGPQADWPEIAPGHVQFRSQIPQRLLNEGDYLIHLIVSLHHQKWICQPGVNAPRIPLRIRGGLSDSPYWYSRRPGLFAPALPWHSSIEKE